MNYIIYFLVTFFVVEVYSFGGNDERFLKKYAMMKIYESCFGEEVVRQIRQELKRACAKCSGPDISVLPPSHLPPGPEERPHIQPQDIPSLNPSYPQHALEAEKIHQAILAFRPNPIPQQSYKPAYPGLIPASFYGGPFANPQFGPAQPFYYPGPQIPQVSFSPYNFPMAGQQYYSNRMSRNVDVKNQLELLTSRMSGKVRNITCVMQELGYLDDNLEPNYVRITERIGNLPVSEELKKDMQEGVAFCQQFSQCVPDVKKDRSPLSRELIRPMFFFKCYKHKKLESCIMKDVREKFSGVSDEEFDSDIELRRTGKDMKFTPENNEEKDIEALEASLYEFLYASDTNLELDGFF